MKRSLHPTMDYDYAVLRTHGFTSEKVQDRCWSAEYLQWSLKDLHDRGVTGVHVGVSTKTDRYERLLGFCLYEEEKMSQRGDSAAPIAGGGSSSSSSSASSPQVSAAESKVQASSAAEESQVQATEVEAAESTGAGAEAEAAARDWVQCDLCDKWRSFGPDSGVKAAELPDRWECSMNTWDAEHNSCDCPEEPQDDDEDDEEEEDEDEEEALAAQQAEHARILQKFKDFLVTNAARLVEKEAAAAAKVKEREEARLAARQNDLTTYLASLSEEQKVAAAAEAKRRDPRTGTLPIHRYPKSSGGAGPNSAPVGFDSRITRLLLRDLHWGVDVDATDKMGRTALHYAYMYACPLYAEALLAAGAHPYVCDVGERCPEELNFFLKPGVTVSAHKARKMDEWGMNKYLD